MRVRIFLILDSFSMILNARCGGPPFSRTKPALSLTVLQSKGRSMLKNLILVAVSLASCAAMADSNDYPGRDYGQHDRSEGFTCISSSQGIPFLGSDSLELMARTNAIKACQADARTNNSECNQQVTCRPNGPSWQSYECTTNSQSNPFASSASNELEAQVQVIKACQADAHTNNSECAQNVQCSATSNHSYSYYSCVSESQSKLFTSSGRDSAVAKLDAIKACQADAHTNNSECMNNAQCEAVYESPSLSACITTSQSVPFTIEERKFHFEIMKDVVDQCQADARTNNSECRSNVQCESAER